MDLCGSLLTPVLPAAPTSSWKNDEHTYPSSIAGATASIVSSVIADYPRAGGPSDAGRRWRSWMR